MRVETTQRFLLIAAASFLIGSCGDGNARTVGGVSGKFCVPPEYRVSNYWWVEGKFASASLGFSFHGCKFSRLSGSSSCQLPSEVRGGSVEPRELNNHVKWVDLKSSVALSVLATPESSRHELLDGGRLLIASAPAGDYWYVFERSQAGRLQQSGLNDDDTLLFSCSPSGKSNQPFECDRYFRGARYSLRYEFDSAERVPVKMTTELDELLVKTIDGWQCDR